MKRAFRPLPSLGKFEIQPKVLIRTFLSFVRVLRVAARADVSLSMSARRRESRRRSSTSYIVSRVEIERRECRKLGVYDMNS